MRYDVLARLLGDQPFFDLAMAVQLSRESRQNLRVQLYRWVKQGKLLSLRRGMCAWPTTYRHVPLNPVALANALHRPSYLSGLWALGFHGLIPEKVVTYTSVTTLAPRRFENEAGVFEYRHIKRNAFFGYMSVEIAGSRVLLAEPEKALLDFWHLSRGKWTEERMTEMRFQNTGSVRTKRLEQYARKYNSPRLRHAACLWRTVAAESEEGTVTL